MKKAFYRVFLLTVSGLLLLSLSCGGGSDGTNIPENPTSASSKEITSIEVPCGKSSIVLDANAKTALPHSMKITLPYGTDVTKLCPTITHNGADIVPLSGSEQNFSKPVVYTVTAADKSTDTYTISVETAASPVTSLILAGTGSGGHIRNEYPIGQECVIYIYTNPNNSCGTVKWSCSDTNALSIVQLAWNCPWIYYLTMHKTGSYTVTFTSVDGAKQASFLAWADSNDPVSITETGSGIKARNSYAITGLSFTMIQCTPDTIPTGGIVFPTGPDSSSINDSYTATINNPFMMGETEVTYQLWETVRSWAVNHGYEFKERGQNGTDAAGNEVKADSIQYPVSNISGQSAEVWCNALTEYINSKNGTNIECVYRSNTDKVTPLRSSTSIALSDVYIKPDAKGFRLPTHEEWDFAARFYGTSPGSRTDLMDHSGHPALTSGYYWIPGNYASGATADYTDETATSAVAVYISHPAGNFTRPAGSRSPNSLGLYDMSGNIAELAGIGGAVRGGDAFTYIWAPADFNHPTPTECARNIQPCISMVYSKQTYGFRLCRSK